MNWFYRLLIPDLIAPNRYDEVYILLENLRAQNWLSANVLIAYVEKYHPSMRYLLTKAIRDAAK